MGFKNMWGKTLINYGWKVGVVENPGDQVRFRLWVVEDAEKQEYGLCIRFICLNTFSGH